MIFMLGSPGQQAEGAVVIRIEMPGGECRLRGGGPISGAGVKIRQARKRRRVMGPRAGDEGKHLGGSARVVAIGEDLGDLSIDAGIGSRTGLDGCLARQLERFFFRTHPDPDAGLEEQIFRIVGGGGERGERFLVAPQSGEGTRDPGADSGGARGKRPGFLPEGKRGCEVSFRLGGLRRFN
jgi:hypothetical protein